MKHKLLIIFGSVALVAGTAWIMWRQPIAPAPLSKETIGAPLRWASLFDPFVKIEERIALAHTVDSTLSLNAVNQWALTLAKDNSSKENEDHFVVWNEIVEQARQRNLHPSALTPFLTGSLSNKDLHPALRDYAAQHLALWVATSMAGQACEQDPVRRASGIASLCAAAGDDSVRFQTIPGTALLALADMEAHKSAELSPHWADLDSALARLIAAEDTPATLRLSAIQAVGTAKRKFHLPAIRRLVVDTKTSDFLLIASVAALGDLGTAEDRPLLESLKSSGSLAAQAAAAALKRLAY